MKNLIILDIAENNKQSYTATGYGSKIHTGKTVICLYDNKIIKRDVFCMIYSNIGSLYIIVDKEKYFIEHSINDYEIAKEELIINHLDTCLDCDFDGYSDYYFQLPLYQKTTTYRDLLLHGLLSVEWVDACVGYETDFNYTYLGYQVAFYQCFKDCNLNDKFITLDDIPNDNDLESVNVYFSIEVQ